MGPLKKYAEGLFGDVRQGQKWIDGLPERTFESAAKVGRDSRQYVTVDEDVDCSVGFADAYNDCVKIHGPIISAKHISNLMRLLCLT